MSGIAGLGVSEFDELTGSGLAVVDFSADWCGPCQTMVPVLERVAALYNGSVRFYRVDVDDSPALAARHGVMSVPTLLVFREGKPVMRVVGVITGRELKKRIDEHIGASR